MDICNTLINVRSYNYVLGNNYDQSILHEVRQSPAIDIAEQRHNGISY
jgi:hypothetical protein